MLIVTGASGQLGKRIVKQLLLILPPDQIGVSVRNPEMAKDLSRSGVRVRRGDYDDPASLRTAWEGATRILLISSNAAAHGGDPLRQHADAIGIACELAVERVLYTSQISSSPTSRFPPGRDHAATEQMLERSGLAWTALRHGFYASSLIALNAAGFRNADLVAPEDGKISWTTHDDLAAADALFLAGREVVDGPTDPLTASEAFDLFDIAQLSEEITGHPYKRTTISDDEMTDKARQTGVPEASITFMLGYFRAARAGEFSAVHPALARILQRAPLTMRDTLSANLI
jgi:uncharacterized protein YbjT (DUF2867 family)